MPSIIEAARTIIFIGGWMSRARWRVRGGRMTLAKAGKAKFVDRVRSITFSARAALDRGKHVWYVTHVGVFRLTRDGLLLQQLMPGIDIERDVLAHSGARINLPVGPVEEVPAPVLTGRNFVLDWPEKQPAGSD